MTPPVPSHELDEFAPEHFDYSLLAKVAQLYETGTCTCMCGRSIIMYMYIVYSSLHRTAYILANALCTRNNYYARKQMVRLNC